MERSCRWPGILALLAGSVHATPPLEAYGQLPGVELVRISPSGERIALIGVVADQRRLAIISADNKLLKTGVVGDSKVRDLNWAGDENVLVTISATVNMQLEFGHAFLAARGSFFVARRHASCNAQSGAQFRRKVRSGAVVTL
jgi:hypothetical protein